MATYSGISEIPLVAGHPALDLVNTVEPRLPQVTPLAPGVEGEAVLDHFATPSGLLVWAGRAGLLTEAETLSEQAVWQASPKVAGRCWAGVVAAREALYAVLLAALDDRGGVGLDDRDGGLDDRDAGLDDRDAGLDDRDAGLGAGVDLGAVEAELALISANRAAAAARSRLRPILGGHKGRERVAGSEQVTGFEQLTGFEQVVGTEPGLVVLDRVAVASVELLTGGRLDLLRACPLEEGGCGWLFLDQSRGRTRRWCVMADCGAKAKARRLNDRRRAARQA